VNAIVRNESCVSVCGRRKGRGKMRSFAAVAENRRKNEAEQELGDDGRWRH
jgi:hypothetical protein